MDGDAPRRLPLSTVRFEPPLDNRNTAPAGRVVPVPVVVERQPGSSASANRQLTVEVSTDDGRTWRAAAVAGLFGSGLVLIRHPSGKGFVSLRARATDFHGNTVEQTVIRAYRFG